MKLLRWTARSARRTKRNFSRCVRYSQLSVSTIIPTALQHHFSVRPKILSGILGHIVRERDEQDHGGIDDLLHKPPSVRFYLCHTQLLIAVESRSWESCPRRGDEVGFRGEDHAYYLRRKWPRQGSNQWRRQWHYRCRVVSPTLLRLSIPG